MITLSVEDRLQIDLSPGKIFKGETTSLTLRLSNLTSSTLEDLLLDVRPVSWNLSVILVSPERVGIFAAFAHVNFILSAHPGIEAMAQEALKVRVECIMEGVRFCPPHSLVELAIMPLRKEREKPMLAQQAGPTSLQVDTAALRSKLWRLDDVELEALALDHFPVVYDKFSRGLRRDEKLNLLLSYVRRHPESATIFDTIQREAPPALKPRSAYRSQVLESRRAALLEDYEAATAQLSHELSDVNRKRIERQIADLERQIEEIEAQLQGAPAPQTPAPANPPGPEPPALQMARRALAHLEMQAGVYAMSEIPTHLQLNLEEKRKQVEELEARWRAGKL